MIQYKKLKIYIYIMELIHPRSFNIPTNSEIIETVSMINLFLSESKDISLAMYFGSHGTGTFSRLSDIDIFFLYRNVSFLGELQKFQKTLPNHIHIDWVGIPDPGMVPGISMPHALMISLEKSRYISGNPELLEIIKVEGPDPFGYLSAKALKTTKHIDFGSGGLNDVEFLSSMFRTIKFLPVNVLGTKLSQSTEIYQQYLGFISSDKNLVDTTKRIRNFLDRYLNIMKSKNPSRGDYLYFLADLSKAKPWFVSWYWQNYNFLKR